MAGNGSGRRDTGEAARANWGVIYHGSVGQSPEEIAAGHCGCLGWVLGVKVEGGCNPRLPTSGHCSSPFLRGLLLQPLLSSLETPSRSLNIGWGRGRAWTEMGAEVSNRFEKSWISQSVIFTVCPGGRSQTPGRARLAMSSSASKIKRVA